MHQNMAIQFIQLSFYKSDLIFNPYNYKQKHNLNFFYKIKSNLQRL